MPAENAFYLLVVKTGKHGLAERRAVRRNVSADTRGHAQCVRSFNLVQIENLIIIEHDNMNGLLGIVHKARQKRPANLPQVQLRDSLVTEFKELDSQMVLTCGGILFDEIVVLKSHQDSMSGASV